MAYLADFYYNYPVGTTSPSQTTQISTNTLLPDPITDFSWSVPSGYEFTEWNTSSDGSGYGSNAGEYPNGEFYMEATISGLIYAIWTMPPKDVSIQYKNTEIASLSASGTKTIATAGKFCEANLIIEYTKPTVTLQSKSVTPSETAQTVTYDSGYSGLSQVSVGAISSTYVGSGVTRKSAQTYTPTTSDQTISASQYLTGAQTILGDADLIAGNIKKDVVIFGVTGTYDPSGILPATGETF